VREGGEDVRIGRLKTDHTADDAGGTVVYRDLVPHGVPGRLGSNLVRVPAGCTTRRHSHAWDQLNVILEGYGILNLDGVDHPVRKGDVIYIEPGEVHCYRNEGEDVLVILGVLGPRPL
jgi:quercetin dioxygenase-like cupin family protein